MPKVRALKLLLAIPVTVGKEMPLILLVPEVALPVRAILKALVVAVPEPLLLVRDKVARLSLLVEVIRVSLNLPDDKVKLPEEITSLPAVKVKFLPLAIVVSPFKEMLPVPVEKVPAPEIPKLPEVWV